MPEEDWSFLSVYFGLGYVPSPLTPFSSVKKLPPATYLVYRMGSEPVVHPYWKLSFLPKRFLSKEEALAQLDHHLREAVQIRLQSDVPFGAFLSGGVDSSVVVALMTLFLPSVKTFSIGFEENAFNELPYANEVAREFKTDHYEKMVKMDALALLPQLAWHLDEPFSDASALPTYHVSKMASERVKMVLSGDGGDELFGGYERYLKERILNGFAPMQALLSPAIRTLEHKMEAGSPLSKLLWWIYRTALPAEDRYEAGVGIIPRGYRKALLKKPDATNSLLGPWFSQFGALPSEEPLLAVDHHTYLPDDILVKVDRMSMACSLEVRAPLLDHPLVEFAASLPFHFKIKGLTGKFILKEYATKFLPRHLVYRKKHGFAVPLSSWFKGTLGDLFMDLIHTEREWVANLFHVDVIQNWWTWHRSGKGDYSERLWSILMLLLWHRTVVQKKRGL